MNITISIILSLLLASLSYIKKAMTKPALTLAFIFSIIICYYGGILSFIVLVTVFLSTIIAHKIKKEKRSKINNSIIEKSGTKDIFQIIANVATGVVFIIIYHFTNNIIFLVSYTCIMAESMADSLASDIGVLSKKEPINILTFKTSPRGLSGNISILGLIFALLGSFIIGIIFMLFNPNLKYFLVIIISSFLGTIIDSILGASIQVKYKCPKCHKVTEKQEHCHIKTEYFKGIKLYNNDLVNLTSNILTGILSLLLLAII